MTVDPTHALHAALSASRHALCARITGLEAQPDHGFAEAFAQVVAAVEAGLRHEEALLDRIGGICLRTRRADDAVILRALHRVTPEVERGDLTLGRDVAAALGAVMGAMLVPPAAGAI